MLKLIDKFHEKYLVLKSEDCAAHDTVLKMHSTTNSKQKKGCSFQL